MIRDPADIAEVFSILHDGRITQVEAGDGVLVLNVQIRYLAQRIAAGYRGLSVTLGGVKDVSFEPWPKDVQRSLPVMTDWGAIFAPVLDILDGDVVDGGIQITCNQAAPEYPYCGGELRLSAGWVEVVDEGSTRYSLEELRSLAAAYWEEWSKNAPRQ
jgi:hypothetical protein